MKALPEVVPTYIGGGGVLHWRGEVMPTAVQQSSYLSIVCIPART